MKDELYQTNMTPEAFLKNIKAAIPKLESDEIPDDLKYGSPGEFNTKDLEELFKLKSKNI